MTNPENYRHHCPPYGYKVRGGKLVIDNQELKICRLVVELIERQGFGIRETGREITKRGYKNRQGNHSWGHFVVKRIFDRWRGKL